jgi:hypothetical protein
MIFEYRDYLGSDKSEVIEGMVSYDALTLTKQSATNYYDILMPAYIEAVSVKGYAPFIKGAEGNKLYNYLRTLTNIPGPAIMAFLLALSELARSGIIDIGFWSPNVAKQVEAYRPKNEVLEALKAAGSQAKTGAQYYLKTVLTAGVIALIGYGAVTVLVPKLLHK